MQDNDGLTRVNTGFGKPKFSRTEVRDIAISILILSVAFTILYRTGFAMNYFRYHTGSETAAYLGLFGLSVVLVVLSFMLHELGHKLVAQNAGLWSEYRMFPMGLVITLVTSMIGFLFAAPGAVYIAGNMDVKTNGRVSIAGPAVNVALAAVGILGTVAFNGTSLLVPFFLLAVLNSFLAVFNLLPIPPLDGSKIMKWNVIIWGCMIAVAVMELVTIYTMDGLYWA